jgi:hypothetical protein
MKSKTDDYNDCLIVWETIWALHALTEMEEKEQENTKQEASFDKKSSDDGGDDKGQEKNNDKKDDYDDDDDDDVTTADKEYDPTLDSLKSESKPCVKLQTFELFSLCICLAIIRAERDVILANKFDGSEILKVT